MNPLEAWFGDCPGAIIAFSAGVDSSLVAALARRFLGPTRCLAVISASPSLKRSELEEGRQFCAAFDIPLQIVQTRELENPSYKANPVDRCYHCKHTLYDELREVAAAHPAWWVLNGQNADDASDYRPGIKAADEFSVRRPLAESGVDKDAVRRLAKELELPVWDKPASPCLSSRIPYGEEVTLEKLERIEKAEEFLNGLGFQAVRVRHRGMRASIEVQPKRVDELREHFASIESHLKTLGFESSTIDNEGLVSGKLNRAIATRPSPAP